MTKSAISKQIADLEIRLGAQLCQRGRSGFALTSAGQMVYDASTTMFSALENFRTKLSALQKHPTGILHIGFIDQLITNTSSPINEILTQFTTKFPDVNVKILTTSAAEIDQAVADRRIQVGFSTDRGSIRSTRALSLFSELSYLYCGSRHALYCKDDIQITTEELNRQKFAQHAYSEAELRDESRTGFTPGASGQFTEAIAMLILTGNYIGFLPQDYAVSWVETAAMRPLLPKNIRKVSKIRILFHEDALAMPLVAAFIETAESVTNGQAG